MIRVLVWNEFCHEKQEERVRAVYPDGIHRAIADFLGREEDIEVECATLDDENCGISAERLERTDVLLWWGHVAHDRVPDSVAVLVRDAVNSGMGLIALHSAHHSKPFCSLLGTPADLTWRESGDSEILWVTDPSHPITRGIDRFFRLEHEETYGEPFIVPEPEKVLLIGSYSGGEVFRSGILWQRGYGKIFYFQPGHETFPTYYNRDVQTLLLNAVRFLAPTYRAKPTCPHVRMAGDPAGYVIRK